MGYLDKSGLQRLWDNLKSVFATKDETFTKTIGGVIKFTQGNTTRTINIGFAPKQFEIYGVGSVTGIYLRWKKDSGWIDTNQDGMLTNGFLYDYYVDEESNTVTMSSHTSSSDELVWRAFG